MALTVPTLSSSCRHVTSHVRGCNHEQPCEARVSLSVRIAYVLAYRAPRYVRTESLLSALRSSTGIEVIVARNKHAGVVRYLETWLALRQLRAETTPDIYLIGFRGHEIFWPIRWLSRGKPLILDAMMSPYASLRDEHGRSMLQGFLAKLIYPFERRMLRRADLVLTDTQLHAEFYARTFSLPLEHFCAVPVGAIEPEAAGDTSTKEESGAFSVLFYGSFLPLHGIDIVVRASARLADLPIRFDFVGGSEIQGRQLRQRCLALGVDNFTHRRWVPFNQLLENDIPNADLCLGGPFGGTPQARRVVTGKTSQTLALGKATVIGRIDEDYGFVNRVNCLLVEQADAVELADAIRWAYDNRTRLREIGANGRALYADRLSIRAITARLAVALQRL